MPDKQQARGATAKQHRQSEHIKPSGEKRGRTDARSKETATQPVNKQKSKKS